MLFVYYKINISVTGSRRYLKTKKLFVTVSDRYLFF